MKPFSPLKPLIVAMFALAAATAQAQITFSPVNGQAYIDVTFTAASDFQAFTFFGSHSNGSDYAATNYSFDFDIFGTGEFNGDAVANGAGFYGTVNPTKTGWTYSGFNLVAGDYSALLTMTFNGDTPSTDMVTFSFLAGNGEDGNGSVIYTLPDGNMGDTIPGTVSYAVTPVPEPESYAMLLAGLGLMGAIARRRSRKA
jgi:hypothetical protein